MSRTAVSLGSMTLDIVIVNWNAGEALARCIETIPASSARGPVVRRVVVDNGSTDGSLERLAESGVPLTILRNAENRGFAAACNQGARGSSADYLLFLNPDTRLEEDSLDVPLRYMDAPENSGVGIVGIRLLDESGEVARSCARAPTARRLWSKVVGLDRLMPGRFPGFIMEDWAHDTTREVDHVIGAFYMVRRPLFETLGGFDERFFVYLEDVDFSVRAARLGWRTVFLAEGQAFHKGGGTSERVKARRLFYSLRSRIQYAHKHFSRPEATLLTLGTLFIEPVVRLGWAAVRGSGNAVLETLQGYGLLWAAAFRRDTYASDRQLGGQAGEAGPVAMSGSGRAGGRAQRRSG